MTRIRVVVTAEDIAKGMPHQPDRCPIALALQRRGFMDAEVGSDDWSPVSGGHGFALSKTAVDFVSAFDAFMGREVSPRTFYLQGPDR